MKYGNNYWYIIINVFTTTNTTSFSKIILTFVVEVVNAQISAYFFKVMLVKYTNML